MEIQNAINHCSVVYLFKFYFVFLICGFAKYLIKSCHCLKIGMMSFLYRTCFNHCKNWNDVYEGISECIKIPQNKTNKQTNKTTDDNWSFSLEQTQKKIILMSVLNEQWLKCSNYFITIFLLLTFLFCVLLFMTDGKG